MVRESSRSARRRQRSVRVTVAVALLTVATAAVLAALPGQSALWLSLAAVLALGCGWAAARIVYSELVQSRRDGAADRAAQAQAYRTLFVERAEDHAEFTTAMTDRLTRREQEVAELTERIDQLQRQRAERAEEAARRDSGAGPEDGDPVADLVAWEQRVSAVTAPLPVREHA